MPGISIENILIKYHSGCLSLFKSTDRSIKNNVRKQECMKTDPKQSIFYSRQILLEASLLFKLVSHTLEDMRLKIMNKVFACEGVISSGSNGTRMSYKVHASQQTHSFSEGGDGRG